MTGNPLDCVGGGAARRTSPRRLLAVEVHQLGRRDLQRLCQAADIHQTDIALPALHAAQIRTRDTRFQRQAFLRITQRLAQRGKAQAKQLLGIGSAHDEAGVTNGSVVVAASAALQSRPIPCGCSAEHQAWLAKLAVLEQFNGRTFTQVMAVNADVWEMAA